MKLTHAMEVLRTDIALIDPQTGESLKLTRDNSGRSSYVSANGKTYPVVRDVIRFVEEESYAGSFGREWERFPNVQFDPANGTHISYYRFRDLAGINPDDLAGKTVLDVGCGAGRFLQVVAEGGALEVWGADLSAAVDVARANTTSYENVRIVQSDLFRLPFGAAFDFVYSFGVLHHTPDPAAAYRAISRHLKPGGRIVVWVYCRGGTSGVRSRVLPHPTNVYGTVVKRLPHPVRDRVLRAYTSLALAAGSIPVVGRFSKIVLPIQDLRKKRPLQDGYEPVGNAKAREGLRFEYALHSAYDQFTPRYTNWYTFDDVRRWAEEAGLVNVRPGVVPTTVVAERPQR